MQEEKLSRSKVARLLTKGAFTTLRADKELVILPMINMLISLLIIATFGFAIFMTGTFSVDSLQNNTWNTSPYVFWATVIAGYITLTFVAHVFEAGVYAGALKRFRGEDPTIKSSLRDVKAKIRPLLLFSLLMSSVGLVLRFIEDRVPLAGKIALWIFGAAWNIANMFAVPAILMSKPNEMNNPINATKESARIIKKIWGESIIAQFGLSIIIFIYMIGILALGGVLAAVMAAIFPGSLVPLFISLPITIIAFFSLMFIATTLTTIMKAALYHYATTGESPEHFSKELLHQAITPKKSRKIFAGN